MVAKKEQNNKQESEKLHLAIVRQMLQLATAGFGLVAALAWNEAIKALIDDYVRPYVGNRSGLISLLVYASAITILAVTVTYQLARLTRKLEKKTEQRK